MEWLEQIRTIFKVHVDSLSFKEAKPSRSINRIIRNLSKESGIPLAVLQMWYLAAGNGGRPPLLCIECGKYIVMLTIRGKYLTKASKHYGLCRRCRTKKGREEKNE